jgi:hypothetical protein
MLPPHTSLQMLPEAGEPGRDAVAVHAAAPEGRREVVKHCVRRLGLDAGVRMVVGMRLA